MMLDFRQRLLTTTLLVGASLIATPAFAQATATPPECPPGTVPGVAGACNPADTAQGSGTQPETTTPVEGTTTVPSTSATGEPVQSAGDIVITGSRIPQPNLTSASPITVLTSQEIKLQGTSRTEDLINSLPQSFAAQGSNISNGSSGTAQVNLRGLGAGRSLVLVNGRRLQPGDTGSPVPDLNFIPTQLVKRVDVLTGGASSVYGADAVGGVVNFIMDNTFTGIRIDAQASVFQHHNDGNEGVLAANAARGYLPPKGLSTNGGAADIAAVLGASLDDGRGHVQAYATYRRQRPVLQSTRDYSFCALQGLREPRADLLGRNFNCGGSATNQNGTFFTATGTFEIGNGNQLVPGFTPFNFAPYNYFQRPDERYTFGAFADYEISSGFKPYLEAMFMDDRTDAQIAPSGTFFNTTGVNCDNPLLSAQQFDVLCNPANNAVFTNGQGVLTGFAYIGRRNVEGGGRDDDIQHTAYRIVGGMRGDITRGISYDGYYQYGRTLRNETYLNDFSITRFQRALDVVSIDANGNIVAPNAPGSTIVCRSVATGLDPNCVPYNIFTQGAVTQAALNYIQTPGLTRGKVDEAIAHVDFTLSGADYGMKTPWAESGIGVNVGAEYRKQSLDLKVDTAFSSGDLSGQGGPTLPVAGKFDVREVFAEVQVPLVEHNFIDLLQISAGYRYSDYKTEGIDPFTQINTKNSFKTKTYKLAGEFAPIKDIKFRAAYNRAVRAPNIIELFAPTGLALTGTVDPCAGATPSFTLAQCQLTGVTAAQYGNVRANAANQYNGVLGGGSLLQPEKADTLTAGVVIQPRFIPGLAITADYFNIKIKNLIGAPSFSGILNQCVGVGGAPDPAACALIFRSPTGSLSTGNGFILQTNQNFPGLGLQTKGFDFSGSYSRRIGGLGTLNASYVGTLLKKLGDQTASGNFVGRFAGGTPAPRYRHKARIGFALPNGIGLSAQWRYFSRVYCDQANDFGCTQKSGGVTYIRPGNSALNAQSYFDLAMTAKITNKFNLRFGAQNIFDRDPPVAGGEVIPAGFGNGNTYPQVYDALGRYMFAGVTVDF
ncbi:MAG: TonB-dependent receptor [Sphingomonas sp.]|nr:TonB-dependent receptor [Sphingomonas sp.]